MTSNKSDDRTCPNCGAESEKVYKCTNCGKIFEEDKHQSARSVLGGSQ